MPVREYFGDGVDRRLKNDRPYCTPTLERIPLSGDQVAAILGAANPKAALRDAYRAHLASDRTGA